MGKLADFFKNYCHECGIRWTENTPSCPECNEDDNIKVDYMTKTNHSWIVKDTNEYVALFQPIAQTLPAGVYKTKLSPRDEALFIPTNSPEDQYVELPDNTSINVIQDIQKFWSSRNLYKSLGLTYKRGIFLYGPPGGGKSTIVRTVSKDIISRGGVVLHPQPFLPDFVTCLKQLRQIHPEVPVVVVIEDIDGLLKEYSTAETTLLSLLDGESQIDNVVYLATTNFPDSVQDRFIRRPGRFDTVIFVGPPSTENRKRYIEDNLKRLPEELILPFTLDQILEDTEGLCIPHIKELLLSVLVLENDYEKVLKKVKNIQDVKHDVEKGSTKVTSLGFKLDT